MGGDLAAAHGRDCRIGGLEHAGEQDAGRRVDVRRAARGVDRRDAVDRRCRGGRLAARVPRSAAPGGTARRARGRGTPARCAARRDGDVAARPSPAPGAAALGARRASRDLGVGGHARLQRRAPDGRIWHDDDGHRRRAGRRRGRVPARQPAGRPRLAGQGAVDDARDERRRRRRRRAHLGVHARGGRDARRVRDQRGDGRDTDGGGDRLRVFRRREPGPRGRGRARGHDATGLPRRIARGWRGVRARRLPGARGRLRRAAARIDTAVRVPPIRQASRPGHGRGGRHAGDGGRAPADHADAVRPAARAGRGS